MSIQKTLLKIKPPRVCITYDVEVGSAVERKELPFVIGMVANVLGDMNKDYMELKKRKFIDIYSGNFLKVLESFNPSINISFKNLETNSMEKHIFSFKSMDDFHPKNITLKIPYLNELLQIRKNLVDLLTKIDIDDVVYKKVTEIIVKKDLQEIMLLDSNEEEDTAPNISELFSETSLLKYDGVKAAKEQIISLCKMLIVENNNNLDKNIETMDSYAEIINIISKIDLKISKQMDEILHNKVFQKLEATWRGIEYLINKVPTSASLKIKLLHATKEEISNDLNKVLEFDQSFLFKTIYEQEFGTLGGTPYSCLIGDYYFGKSSEDVKLLKKISEVAAAAHAPFISAVAPDMFSINSFSKIGEIKDLSRVFEISEMAAWRSFRNTDDAKYISLLLPRVLMRAPYKSGEGFNYTEEIDSNGNDHFCWGNPAYVFAERLSNAYNQYGWTAAIRGVEGGGKVENLPAYCFNTENGDVELKCPTQVSITDRREKELSDLGFIALCHCKDTDYSVFFGAQTCQKPKIYTTTEATANSMICARLTYLINASRFAHYIKVLMRDKIGSFVSSEDIQKYLQNWIANYVLLSDTGSQELKAKYPLREASIEVIEDVENPSAYKSVIFLRPHFQLEELTVSLRMVAKLNKAS